MDWQIELFEKEKGKLLRKNRSIHEILVELLLSLGKAIELAKEIAKFPQECMLRDRASAWHATYSAPNFQQAVEHEMSNSLDVIAQVKYLSHMLVHIAVQVSYEYFVRNRFLELQCL